MCDVLSARGSFFSLKAASLNNLGMVDLKLRIHVGSEEATFPPYPWVSCEKLVGLEL